MAQFDVFENPVVKTRATYPFVVALQADLTTASREEIVAPLVPRVRIGAIAGRLTPVVRVEDGEFVALITSLVAIRRSDLVNPRCSVASLRSELLAAVDYLFFGV